MKNVDILLIRCQHQKLEQDCVNKENKYSITILLQSTACETLKDKGYQISLAELTTWEHSP